MWRVNGVHGAGAFGRGRAIGDCPCFLYRRVKLSSESLKRTQLDLRFALSLFSALLIVALFWYHFIHNGKRPVSRVSLYNIAKSDMVSMKDVLDSMGEAAGGTNLRALYDPAEFEHVASAIATDTGRDLFEVYVDISTRLVGALLGHGGAAHRVLAASDEESDRRIAGILNVRALSKVRTSRWDVPRDPWGNAYMCFLGPWPEDLGLILFRCYERSRAGPGSENARVRSNLPVNIQNADELTLTVGDVQRGIPAVADLDLYIWSYGANGMSDQPRYIPSHTYAPPPESHYRARSGIEFLGGGDDINNWDLQDTALQLYVRKSE